MAVCWPSARIYSGCGKCCASFGPSQRLRTCRSPPPHPSRSYTLAIVRKNTVRFWLLVVLLGWLTHALGYLIHEYAHSFSAWTLGFKADPFALDYGHWTPANVAFLVDVDENVEYGPIFAAGKGYLAALIALNGVLIGNGVFYLISRRLYSFARQRRREILGLFAFFWCLMNVGNLLCYVPVRTFTTHADMATLERGLHISPWWVAAVLGIPFAIGIWHFFARLQPDAWRFLLPDRRIQQAALLVVTSFTVFVFPYGSSGMRGYGEVSRWMSTLSVCVLFPAVAILCWPRKTRRSEDGQLQQGAKAAGA